VEVRDEFQIWRLILEGIATLEELETTWSLDDAQRAEAMLNLRKAVEDQIMKKK